MNSRSGSSLGGKDVLPHGHQARSLPSRRLACTSNPWGVVMVTEQPRHPSDRSGSTRLTPSSTHRRCWMSRSPSPQSRPRSWPPGFASSGCKHHPLLSHPGRQSARGTRIHTRLGSRQAQASTTPSPSHDRLELCFLNGATHVSHQWPAPPFSAGSCGRAFDVSCDTRGVCRPGCVGALNGVSHSDFGCDVFCVADVNPALNEAQNVVVCRCVGHPEGLLRGARVRHTPVMSGSVIFVSAALFQIKITQRCRSEPRRGRGAPQGSA